MEQNNIITVKSISDSSNNNFIHEELPILIKGGCKNWPAYKKWSADFFAEAYGNVSVPMSNYKEDPYQRADTKPDMPIADYLKLAQAIAAGKTEENQNLYSAGWFFCQGYCELLNDVITPECFKDNWADKVQQVIHFDTRSILFGHPKVESPLHTDSFFVSTWFAAIRGQKRMRLVAPEHTKHVHNGYNVFDPEVVNTLREKDVPVYEVIIAEGDIVWFPPGWWHHVKNDTFTISLTTNFVDAYHFLPFEQQVRATLIKPLLRLDKLKNQCMAPVLENLADHSTKVIKDSIFVPNESKYVDHFQQILDRTRTILKKVS